MVAVVAVVGVAKTELSDEDPLLDTEELLEDNRLLLLDEDRLELTLELLEEEDLEDIEAEIDATFPSDEADEERLELPEDDMLEDDELLDDDRAELMLELLLLDEEEELLEEIEAEIEISLPDDDANEDPDEETLELLDDGMMIFDVAFSAKDDDDRIVLEIGRGELDNAVMIFDVGFGDKDDDNVEICSRTALREGPEEVLVESMVRVALVTKLTWVVENADEKIEDKLSVYKTNGDDENSVETLLDDVVKTREVVEDSPNGVSDDVTKLVDKLLDGRTKAIDDDDIDASPDGVGKL
ncbi:hypothetical protein VTO58DRAFT_107494 [Aureobasidium pullulans]